MNYLELFASADPLTKKVILGVNLCFVLYYLISSRENNKIAVYGIAILALGILYYVVGRYSGSGFTFKVFFAFYQLPALLTTLLLVVFYKGIKRVIPKKPLGEFDISIPTKKGKSIVFNILRGVSVQGAAGSGKTASVAGWILKWVGERSMPGLVYDFKNFELTEVVLWFYRASSIPVHIFAAAQPTKSIALNPLAPEILQRPEDVLLMSKSIVNNVLKLDSRKGADFFTQAAEGAIAGVIIKLKEDYPSFCSFPYLAAIFLSYDADRLVGFIESNPTASRQARAFLDSAKSDKQMAGVKASLSNAFRVFDMPTLFYTLRSNDISLALNDPKAPCVLCMVNSPKYVEIYSGLFSVVTQACILEMSQRNRKGSFLLFDEAPTLRVHKMERVPATMRSFGIATIYMLQDKIQAANQVGSDIMKEILSNLSTLFFGKTNDPETAKFFESYFPEIKVKQKSFSKKTGLFGGGDARVNESQKDEKQHKSYEMFKRKTGEFFVFDQAGNSYDASIKLPDIQPQPVKDANMVTDEQIQQNYDTIFANVAREFKEEQEE